MNERTGGESFFSRIEPFFNIASEILLDVWAEYLAQTYEHRSVFEEREKARRETHDPQDITGKVSLTA